MIKKNIKYPYFKEEALEQFHCNNPLKFNISVLLNNKIIINNNSLLLLEPFNYHYECTSGFSKYFLDLGFNVDILMHENGKDSLYLLEQKLATKYATN